MKIWAYSLISVFLVSIISLIGITTISLDMRRLKKILLFLVSFAVGALFGDAFIHLLPASYKSIPSDGLTSLLIIAGILTFFALEKFIYWRHCHVPAEGGGLEYCKHTKAVVYMNLLGDALHNTIDGVIIGASYAVSVPIGLATTIAVLLHEIPQEIGDFGILLHGGLTRKKALALNFLCSTLAILGCALTLAMGPRIKEFSLYVIPFTAGGFIYIAGSDLIPELNKEIRLSKAIYQLAAIVSGVIVMALLLFLE